MLDQAFEALKTYDWGTDPKVLNPIDEAVVATRGDAAARKELETRLAAVLKTDVSRDAKDFVCRKLTVIGTAASVPTLAALLADEDLSHMARYALERIPAPEAAQAMRDALPKIDNALKVGVMGSLGVRQDVASVPALAPCWATRTRRSPVRPLWRWATFALRKPPGRCGKPSRKRPRRRSPPPTPVWRVPKDCWRTGRRAKRWRCTRDSSAKISPSTFAWRPRAACWPAPARANEPRSYSTSNRTRDFPDLAIVLTGGLGHEDVPAICWCANGLPGRLCLRCRPPSFADVAGQEGTGDELVQMVVNLLSDKDKDVRALGLEQVRTEAKGPAATQQFAAQLPKLPPEVQAALLSALADRGDTAARPAVFDLLAASPDEAVRLAAIGALGFLGEPADARLLMRLLTEGSPAEQAAARTALTRLPGESVSTAVAAEMKQANARCA